MTAFDLIKLIAYDLIKSYLRRFFQCCKYMIEALTIITIKSNLQKSLKTCDCILTVPSGLYSFSFFSRFTYLYVQVHAYSFRTWILQMTLGVRAVSKYALK